MKEIPMISSTMWTLKDIREANTVLKIKELFAMGNDIFIPSIIYGGKLTQKKNKSYDINNLDDVNLFENCFYDSRVLSISLTNSDRNKREVIFGFTIDFVPRVTVITFEVSHTYFKTQSEKEKYISIVKQLISITDPIFCKIDDIASANNIMDEMGEGIYQLENYIPAIFWGNYFGEKYINQLGEERLANFPFGNISRVDKGIMITMTNDPMEFNSDECVEVRKKLSKYLGIGKFRLFKKIFGQ